LKAFITELTVFNGSVEGKTSSGFSDAAETGAEAVM
jgi:glutamine amidotransferase-like uncharacterized protein